MQDQELTSQCPPLAFSGQMRELDRRTIEEVGIPGSVLMENAGRATVDAMEAHFGPVCGKTVLIFAGPGNNGGDGLVIARWVHGRGGRPLVLLMAEPHNLPPDAALNRHILQRLALPCRIIRAAADLDNALDDAEKEYCTRPLHSVVDALFGIGLARPLEGIYLQALRAVNSLTRKQACPVVAADIPSGLNSDTGQVLGEAVQASLTVCYGMMKPGHLHHGGAVAGMVQVADIGIPKKIVAEAGLTGIILDHSIRPLLNRRPLDAHKGSNGHVLVLAGSTGKTGAALLTAQGVLRSGAGLVSCAIAANLFPIFAGALLEAMYAPLAASCDCLNHADYAAVAELCRHKQALVIGPGIGLADETTALVLRLYQEQEMPMVVDADALTILAANRDILARPGGPRIFTPHPGEMARLLDEPIAGLQADRLAAAQKLCRLCKHSPQPIVAVLKGAGTVVAASDGRWAINRSGNAGMATGGMGDVLAGIIAGLLGQGHSPWQAACAGVWLHGAAADLLAKERAYGYSASEVAAALPRLFTPT
ncbi:MAG: NAD(P)H-hydrate dehydratase [bacterium]|nr:NAD(P)H-hydrate dehydratase [bacterium]